MAGRKTIQKYYPSDFDPSRIPRNRRTHTKRGQVVNFACPFRTIRCLSCSSYTTKGTVFRNTPKHISDETYLGCQIVRLHAKCPSCRAEIVIETDPMNMDYRIVSGAKMGYEVWRDDGVKGDTVEGRLDRLEREDRDNVEANDPDTAIEKLERKAEDARTEMAVADALDAVQAANARREVFSAKPSISPFATERNAQELQDAELARAVFRKTKRAASSFAFEDCHGVEIEEARFTKSRPVKRAKKDFAAVLGIKKRPAF